MLWGYDVTPIQEIAHKVQAVYERVQPFETDPMTDFDERELLRLAEETGFTKIHLELEAGINHQNLAATRIGWERAWKSADNPCAPTLAEAVKQALTSAEAEAFVAYLRPKLEREPRIARTARAFLWAVK
jgi:hypothetical protein